MDVFTDARRILETFDPARVNDPAQEFPFLLDFTLILNEVFELHQIYETFGNEPAHVIQSKLQRLVSGPLSPRVETAKNADSRNILFELSLAALLHSRGLEVGIGEPDIHMHMFGIDFLVECKRPVLVKTLAPNIRGANRQLAKALAERADSRGIIAISMSHILRCNQGLVLFDTEIDKWAYQRLLLELLEATRLEWLDIRLHPQVAGLLFHSSTLATLKEERKLSTLHSIHFHSATEEPPVQSALEQLAQLFGAEIHP